MNYVLNAYVNEQGKEIDGYQTAARLAGMIGACASNSSLTHTVVNGFSEILERLTNTQMIAAEKKGCIVLSYSSVNRCGLIVQSTLLSHRLTIRMMDGRKSEE